jgi:hypothetical protein
MGYGYGYNPRTGREALACDGCGQSEGRTRKRPCRFTVTHYDDGRSPGGTLRYCPAPAYCPECFRHRGGARGIHSTACEAGARASQAREDAKRDRLANGDAHIASRFGSWHETVPETLVGAVYVSLDGAEHSVLVRDDDDRADWLSDAVVVAPWDGPYVPTKEVTHT